MTIRSRRAERGVALVAVAIFMGMILALTVVGVDIGHLAQIANEAQAVADATAAAGARGLNDAGGVPGTSDPDAHTISANNFLNGIPPPNEDVLVDEGFFNSIDGTFECCTTNSSCCAAGSWGSLTCTAAGGDRCDRRSAVLATARTTVQNIVASVLAAPTTDVEKLAIAAFQGPSDGCNPPMDVATNTQCGVTDWACWCRNNRAPCLPIAVPSCRFPNPCPDTGCDLPHLQVSNSGSDTAAWTGYNLGHNASTVRSFFPQECHNGFHNDIPGQSIAGNQIDVTNGLNPASDGNVFGATQCVVNNGLGCTDANNDGIFEGAGGSIFTIPVFDMGDCTENMSGVYDVVGFAAITIEEVIIDGDTKRIDLEAISHTETGPVGTTNSFGSGRVTLIR